MFTTLRVSSRRWRVGGGRGGGWGGGVVRRERGWVALARVNTIVKLCQALLSVYIQSLRLCLVVSVTRKSKWLPSRWDLGHICLSRLSASLDLLVSVLIHSGPPLTNANVSCFASYVFRMHRCTKWGAQTYINIYGDQLEVTVWPILGNLSCCKGFFIQCEEPALVGDTWHHTCVWLAILEQMLGLLS